MRILVFGATGYIGGNIFNKFSTFYEVISLKITESEENLRLAISECDIIFNCVGVSRSSEENDYFQYNMFYAQRLYSICQTFKGKTIVYLSSIHYHMDTLYGICKRYNEYILNLQNYGNRILCFRLPGVFGPGVPPNYVSVVGTFCYNIANDLPCSIEEENKMLRLIYIDDLLELIKNYIEKPFRAVFELISDFQETCIKVGDLYRIVMSFKNSDINLENEEFILKLFLTYQYYINK